MSDGKTNTIAVSSTAEEMLSLISLAVSSDSTRQVLSVTTQCAFADAAIAPSKVGSVSYTHLTLPPILLV